MWHEIFILKWVWVVKFLCFKLKCWILGLVSCSFVGGNAIIQTVDYVTFNAAIVKVFWGSSSLCYFNKICNFWYESNFLKSNQIKSLLLLRPYMDKPYRSLQALVLLNKLLKCLKLKLNEQFKPQFHQTFNCF